MVWTEAQASCQAEGAFLAEITYAAEQNFVVDMIMAQGIDDGSLFAIGTHLNCYLVLCSVLRLSETMKKLYVGMKLEGGEKWTSGSWASYTNWFDLLEQFNATLVGCATLSLAQVRGSPDRVHRLLRLPGLLVRRHVLGRRQGHDARLLHLREEDHLLKRTSSLQIAIATLFSF